jgi:hypothetical protein
LAASLINYFNIHRNSRLFRAAVENLDTYLRVNGAQDDTNTETV